MELISVKILNAKEACKFLQISETSLYRYANLGTIPGQKIGSEWRFSEDALAEWLGSKNPDVALNELKIRIFESEEENKRLKNEVKELNGKLVKFEKIGELLNDS